MLVSENKNIQKFISEKANGRLLQRMNRAERTGNTGAYNRLRRELYRDYGDYLRGQDDNGRA